MRLPPHLDPELRDALADLWAVVQPWADNRHIDLGGRRLVNVGDAVAPSDGVTKRQWEAWRTPSDAGTQSSPGALATTWITGTLRPNITNLWDIGQSAFRFKDGWFAGIVRADQVGLSDTNDSHHLLLTAGSDLTADRALTFTTGDAARTVTLTGNPTLNDWFDQSVKTTASPTFAALTTTALAALTTIAESWVGPSTTNGVYFKAGKVGVGTVTPRSKLDVVGGAIGISDGYGLFADPGGAHATGINFNSTSKLLQFYVDNAEKIRVDVSGKVGINTTGAAAQLAINGGLHVGGDSDPGDNNLLVDGTAVVTGGFGCNGTTAQTAYASGGALAAYGAGANGLDTAAHMSALYAMVVAIRAALVANGIMS